MKIISSRAEKGMLLAKDFIRCYLKRPAWEPWEGRQKLLNQVGKWTDGWGGYLLG